MTADVLSITASPQSLWPPNGRFVPVTVSGLIADDDGFPVGANFQVLDEYGAVQPSGPVALQDNLNGTFSYGFTVELQARRLGRDRDGRQYTIVVDAFDDHSDDSEATVVTVPHDQGRRGSIGVPGGGRGRGNAGPFLGDDRDDDRGGRRFDAPGRRRGREVRDFIPIGRDDDGPGRDFDDDARGGRGRGRGRGRD